MSHTFPLADLGLERDVCAAQNFKFFKVKEINHYFFFAQPPLKFPMICWGFLRKKIINIFFVTVCDIASLWVDFMKPHMVITTSSIFL